MFSTTTMTEPPIAQEQQHHQPGQHGAEQRPRCDALHGPGHVGRLVEFEAQIDVLGQRVLHFGSSALTWLTTASVDASARLLTIM